MTTLAQDAVSVSPGTGREEPRSLRVARRAARRSTRSEYKALTFFATLLFLVVALVARILPRSVRVRFLKLPVSGGSVLHDARVMVAMTIPFVFMG
jgi:hypothetical protein